MSEIPVACSLDPAALETRRQGLLRELLRLAESRAEQTDGYACRFAPAPELLSLVARVIDAERRCCRFLTFQLTVAADEGPVHLRLTGPPGTREFLSSLFADEAASGEEVRPGAAAHDYKVQPPDPELKS